MELTRSFERVFPTSFRKKYEFAEVRNAAATLLGTDPEAFDHITQILSDFELALSDLTDPGGSKGAIARHLDLAFRERGWREAGHKSETRLVFRLEPFKPAGESKPEVRMYDFGSEGHKVDNVFGRVALEVEWNAKDGNLDRDLANFRALHDAAVIDVGVLITRHHERTKFAANTLAEKAGLIRYDPKGKRIVLLGTSTTTNIEKLTPRMERGDGGGCPILAVAITERSYTRRRGEPALPSYKGPIKLIGVPEPATE